MVSGLRLNKTKSSIFQLTLECDRPLQLTIDARIPVTHSTIKYLGIQVYHTLEAIREGNLGRIMAGLRASAEFWTRLNLSSMGRLALAKMVALPRLLYFFATVPCPVPRGMFRELNSRLKNLIWGGCVTQISPYPPLPPIRFGWSRRSGLGGLLPGQPVAVADGMVGHGFGGRCGLLVAYT